MAAALLPEAAVFTARSALARRASFEQIKDFKLLPAALMCVTVACAGCLALLP